ncbi:sigma factor-like helix-turn-helix DNA-binding protein [Nocardia tengchongensis]|uniref:sigma factor-like helix-turn-helix DNA-binding protein n=1 Tax=Nocardia tengchongensis TaxID=2055889 RepID=UPI0036C21FAF
MADEAAVCRRPCGTTPLEKSRRNDWSYTEIADRLGITKGRISQIRSTAPGPERAILGVGGDEEDWIGEGGED